MNTRLSSHIPSLDEKMGGGFLPESINLVFGAPGTGKSTFGLQLGCLLGRNNPDFGVAYFSLEEDYKRFKRNTSGLKLCYDHILFEYYRPEELQKHINDGIQSIDGELKKNNVKLLVIDSVSAYLSNSTDERFELKRLFDMLNRWNVTAILISEETEKTGLIQYLVDSVIRLGLTDSKERTLEVLKMRGTKHSLKKHNFTITEMGIQLK